MGIAGKHLPWSYSNRYWKHRKRAWYVAFSRATKLSNICVGSGFSVERLTTMISKGKKLINRLVEDERLQLLYLKTLERLTEIRNLS